MKAGSNEARIYYENVKQRIWKLENQQQIRSAQASIDELIEIVLLKSGAEIASKIIAAMERDKRFAHLNQRWYLHAWIQDIPKETLHRVHSQILKTTKTATLSQIRDQIPDLPNGDIGEISLMQVLSKVPDLFQPSEDGWQAVPPPPPP